MIGTGGGPVGAAASGFAGFAAGLRADLGRLAYLLTGDHVAADDAVDGVLTDAARRWTPAGADQVADDCVLAVVRQSLVLAEYLDRGRDDDFWRGGAWALQRLTPDQRVLVALSAYPGLDAERSATLLEAKPRVVRRRLAGGYAALAKHLRVADDPQSVVAALHAIGAHHGASGIPAAPQPSPAPVGGATTDERSELPVDRRDVAIAAAVGLGAAFTTRDDDLADLADAGEDESVPAGVEDEHDDVEALAATDTAPAEAEAEDVESEDEEGESFVDEVQEGEAGEDVEGEDAEDAEDAAEPRLIGTADAGVLVAGDVEDVEARDAETDDGEAAGSSVDGAQEAEGAAPGAVEAEVADQGDAADSEVTDNVALADDEHVEHDEVAESSRAAATMAWGSGAVEDVEDVEADGADVVVDSDDDDEQAAEVDETAQADETAQDDQGDDPDAVAPEPDDDAPDTEDATDPDDVTGAVAPPSAVPAAAAAMTVLPSRVPSWGEPAARPDRPAQAALAVPSAAGPVVAAPEAAETGDHEPAQHDDDEIHVVGAHRPPRRVQPRLVAWALGSVATVALGVVLLAVLGPANGDDVRLAEAPTSPPATVSAAATGPATTAPAPTATSATSAPVTSAAVTTTPTKARTTTRTTARTTTTTRRRTTTPAPRPTTKRTTTTTRTTRPPAPKPAAVPPGLLRNAASGLCAEVPTSPAWGTQVALAKCVGGPGQEVRFRRSGILLNNLCLDDFQWGTAPGTQVIVWGCTGQANQRWVVGGDGTLRNEFAGLCVAATGSKPGAGLVLASCAGGGEQVWRRT